MQNPPSMLVLEQTMFHLKCNRELTANKGRIGSNTNVLCKVDMRKTHGMFRFTAVIEALKVLNMKVLLEKSFRNSKTQ